MPVPYRPSGWGVPTETVVDVPASAPQAPHRSLGRGTEPVDGSWDGLWDATASTVVMEPVAEGPPSRRSGRVRAEKGRHTVSRSPRRRRQWIAPVVALVVTGLAGGGGWLAWDGAHRYDEGIIAVQVPAPPDSSVGPDAPVRGDDGTGPVQVVDDDGGGATTMSVSRMAPMTLFIPSLGVYSPLVATDSFTASRYEGLDTLAVPSDPRRTAWYSGGGALAGGEEGTTLLAGHVSYGGQWGALRYLSQTEGGNLVYAADATGVVSAWKVTRVWTAPHTEFPQDLWDATGVRRLVITSCVDLDPVTKAHYLKNLFVEALPYTVPA